MSDPTRPAIVIDGLTKRFRPLRSYRDIVTARWRTPGRAVVDQVALDVPAGQVFGLLGQNGAGKSTLVRMLATLLLPSSGQASVLGFDVVRQASAIRGRIGLVNGDERSFSWRLTGRHNLEFFAALQHLPGPLAAGRLQALAEQLDVAEHLDRPYGELSSGQRQKLSIIRGLLSEPELLFMDEPTRSLDPISAVTIRTFIQEEVIGRMGRTVVLATHSMPEAEALCARVAFLQLGSVVATGSVAELRATIGYAPRCELVLRATPVDLEARLRGVTDVLTVALSTRPTPDGINVETVAELTVRAGFTLDGVLTTLMAAGVTIVRCEMREASLEDIYVHTLGSAPTPRPAAPTGEPAGSATVVAA